MIGRLLFRRHGNGERHHLGVKENYQRLAVKMIREGESEKTGSIAESMKKIIFIDKPRQIHESRLPNDPSDVMTKYSMMNVDLPSPTTTSLLSIIHGRRIAFLEDQLQYHETEIENMTDQMQIQRLVMLRLVKICAGMGQKIKVLSERDHRLAKLLQLVTFHLKIIKKSALFQEGKSILNGSIIWKMLRIFMVHFALRVGGIYDANSALIKAAGSLLLTKNTNKFFSRGIQRSGDVALYLATYYAINQIFHQKSFQSLALSILSRII